MGLFLMMVLCSTMAMGLVKSDVLADDKSSKGSKVSPVTLSNELMLVFMDRMKTGNYKGAREVANDMIKGAAKYNTNTKVEFKSFESIVEKTLYELLQVKDGNKSQINWTQQPIADGYYLLAMLDFQQGNHKSALKNIGKAIYWNPVHSAFYAERGFMLLKKKSGPDRLMAQIAYTKALELAATKDDFAAALQGLAFILIDRGQLKLALACLIVEKEFLPNNLDAEQEIAFIGRNAPSLLSQVNLTEARKLLKERNILSTFAPIHVKVLIKLADKFATKNKKKAISLLEAALKLNPTNQKVIKKLKALTK